MRPFMLAAAVAAAFLVGCEQESAELRASSSAPATASGGATAGTSSTGPAGDKMALPESPKGTASAETKPDPGDANDHSNPQHDSKSKKDGD